MLTSFQWSSGARDVHICRGRSNRYSRSSEDFIQVIVCLFSAPCELSPGVRGISLADRLNRSLAQNDRPGWAILIWTRSFSAPGPSVSPRRHAAVNGLIYAVRHRLDMPVGEQNQNEAGVPTIQFTFIGSGDIRA